MRVTISERWSTVSASCRVTPPSNSSAVSRIDTWSKRARYLSRVASAWLALASTAGISWRTYFAPPVKSVTTLRRSEIDTTSASVCLDTRSAVRCRVPVSRERIVGSGVSCTFAHISFVEFWDSVIAPSIFASWNRKEGVYSMSSLMPPESSGERPSSSPITISAPVRASTQLSMPSLSAVPGATISSALRSRGSCRE